MEPSSPTDAIGATVADSDTTELYMCTACGWIYDESIGLPEAGVPPGTRWEDVPEDFLCPECGEGKDVFEKIEG